MKILRMLDLKFTAVTDFSPIFQNNAITDLRVPANTKVACSSDITNPELTKICQ